MFYSLQTTCPATPLLWGVHLARRRLHAICRDRLAGGKTAPRGGRLSLHFALPGGEKVQIARILFPHERPLKHSNSVEFNLIRIWP